MESFDRISQATRTMIGALQGLSTEERAACIENVLAALSLGRAQGATPRHEASSPRASQTHGGRSGGSQGHRGGRGGGGPSQEARASTTSAPAPRGEAKNEEAKAGETVRATNYLRVVGERLEPILQILPRVVRQDGASPPSMDSKSVRERLVARRKALNRSIKDWTGASKQEGEQASACFRFVNALQSFRIAARDAISSHVALSSSPFEGVDDSVIESLVRASIEFVRVFNREHILPTGFFADEGRQYARRAPEGSGSRSATSSDQGGSEFGLL